MARIFVVEDDAPIRNEVIEVLERQSFEVSYCLTFDRVVDDILAARPDLVPFCDGRQGDEEEGDRGMARIFVVEDDAPIRNEVIEVLERHGFEVSYCLTFDRVVDDILAARPDLVLLDLTLPGTDGQLICRELRQHSDIPVIVLTSRVT